MIENIKGYRTVLFNVAVGLLMIWRAVAPGDEIPSESQVSTLIDSLFASLDAVLVVGNLILRKITDTPLGSKY